MLLHCWPSVLWWCYLGGRKGIWPVKNWVVWQGAGVVICLEWGADLHMAQLMPLPLTVSCVSEIQIGYTFLVPAHSGSPGKGPLNGCVFMIIMFFVRKHVFCEWWHVYRWTALSSCGICTSRRRLWMNCTSTLMAAVSIFSSRRTTQVHHNPQNIISPARCTVSL